MRAVLQWLSRMPPRQLSALCAVTVTALAALAAGAIGQLGWATGLLALLGLAVFGAVVQLRRRLVAVTVAALRGELAEVEQRMVGELRALPSYDPQNVERMEAAHRRILAAVETERLAAADRQQELFAKIERSARGVTVAQREQAQDVQALLQLYRDFRPRAPMPPFGSWALNAVDLLEVFHLVERHQPPLVLELGSGTSTVWLGYVLERYGGRLISVDHSPEYAERTRSMLALHSLEGTAQVRLAPLRPFHVDGRDFRWYDEQVFADVGEAGFLLVDGPPGATGQDARYPALPLLLKRLAPGAVIVLDDAQRPDEQEIVNQWLAAYPSLSRRRSVFDRQAVLTYTAG